MASGIAALQNISAASGSINANAINAAKALPSAAFQGMLSDAMASQANQVVANQAGALSTQNNMKSRQISNSVSENEWLVTQALDVNQQQGIDQFSNNSEIAQIEDDYLSERLTPQNISTEEARATRLTSTPFQVFLDKGVEFFRRVSGMEKRADELMERFALGEVSLEELTIEKAKVGVAISFSVTLVTQVTQAFNELKQMQI